MLVTINTDASFKDGYAAYAFWITCDAGKIQKAGKFKEKLTGSHEAEMRCIGNALHTLKHSRFAGITKVIINTDSKHCIGKLGNGARMSSPAAEECILTMLEICLKFGQTVRALRTFFEYRHVKAHSGKKDKRSYVNEWCDTEAKKQLNLLIQSAKK